MKPILSETGLIGAALLVSALGVLVLTAPARAPQPAQAAGAVTVAPGAAAPRVAPPAEGYASPKAMPEPEPEAQAPAEADALAAAEAPAEAGAELPAADAVSEAAAVAEADAADEHVAHAAGDAPEAEAEAVADGARLAATDLPGGVIVDPDFGAMVRAFLLQNPEVIFEAVAEFERRAAVNEADIDRQLIVTEADALFNSANDWVGGNPDGDITLVKFLDYRCGFCRRAHDELQQVFAQDPGIRFVIKELPILGPESELSARFAIAVLQLDGADAYKAAHDALITLEGAPDRASLSAIAAAIGVDFASVVQHMASDSVASVIAENRQLAQRMRISGTPVFVMESELIRGFVPADTLLEIAAELRD